MCFLAYARSRNVIWFTELGIRHNYFKIWKEISEFITTLVTDLKQSTVARVYKLVVANDYRMGVFTVFLILGAAVQLRSATLGYVASRLQ